MLPFLTACTVSTLASFALVLAFFCGNAYYTFLGVLRSCGNFIEDVQLWHKCSSIHFGFSNLVLQKLGHWWVSGVTLEKWIGIHLPCALLLRGLTKRAKKRRWSQSTVTPAFLTLWYVCWQVCRWSRSQIFLDYVGNAES